jgi:hypothetical protein
MKTVMTNLALLCGLSVCLSAFAEIKNEGNPIVLSSLSTIANINCNGLTTDATFRATNTDKNATIWVDPNKIINHDDFPDELIVIEPYDAPYSKTTCDDTDLKPGASCDINLLIQPASCDFGVVLGPINRTLVLSTGTMYEDPTAEIEFAYTTLGAGDSFAILGKRVFNLGGGPVMAKGDVGHTGIIPIFGLYNVTDGVLYQDPNTQAVLNAQNDFNTAYEMFKLKKAVSGCKDNYPLPKIVTPGYACLEDGVHGISLDGSYHLEGDGEFVFFIGEGKTCFSLNSRPSSACNLYFGPSVNFTYDEINDPTLPNRVYWVVGSGIVDLTNGARIIGTILAGRGPIFEDPNGTDHTTVKGRIWSQYHSIDQYGGTVTRP